MKFLIIATTKDIMFTLPPAIARQLLEATAAWVNQQKQAGTLLEIYGMAGWVRTIAIEEHESAEAVAQTVAGNPLGAFLNHEVYPLADFDEVMKANIESVKKAEQLFPAAPK